MLSKTLIAAAVLAASTGVMADSDTRVYGSVVIADPNFSVAVSSGYPYWGPHYWAPPPVRYYSPKRYYYPPRHYYYYPDRHYYKHHYKHYDRNHRDDHRDGWHDGRGDRDGRGGWDDRGGHGGR